MNPALTWHFARAGGLVAWWALAAAVFFGLMLSTRLLPYKAGAPWVLDVHRFLSGVAVTFTGVHVTALMLDKYVKFGPMQVLVPFASKWRPGAVAWGIVAFYLLIAIETTSLMMKRIPRKLWRYVHSSSFILFLSTGVHAFTAGKDATNVAVQWSALLMSAIFTFLLIFRQLAGKVARRSATA